MVRDYNAMLSSIEGRLIPAANKLRSFGGAARAKDLPELAPVDQLTNQLNEASGGSTTRTCSSKARARFSNWTRLRRRVGKKLVRVSLPSWPVHARNVADNRCLLTLALAVTLVLLVFARDVARAAHGSTDTRRSENRSFAGLANALIVQENDFDQSLVTLLHSGATLTRPVLDTQLEQLRTELVTWTTEAQLLRRPRLAHDVNEKLEQLTLQRIDAYNTILNSIARQLTLPPLTPISTDRPVTAPAQLLITTGIAWNADRYDLTKEPGRQHLAFLTYTSAKYFISFGTQALTSSTSLAVVRGIGVAAVSISPAPFPATHGELLLPPVSQFHVGVSVTNTGYVEQPVTVNVTMTPSNGPHPTVRQSFHLKLAPLQSYAVVPHDFATVPSERATLVISVSGAPAGANLTTTRTYNVVMSPTDVPGAGVVSVDLLPTASSPQHNELALPAIHSFHAVVSVENANSLQQSLTLAVTLRPTNGSLAPVRQVFKLSLAPQQTLAVATKNFATQPGETADLLVTVSGTPIGTGLSKARTYHVVLSRSGNH